MKKNRLYPLFAAAVMAASIGGCENSTAANLIDDATITKDVAASAGDAIALSVADMLANESFSTLPNVQASPGYNLSDNSVTYSRSRKCYDITGAELNPCSPLSAVRTIVTTVALDGSRTGSNPAGTVTWSGVVHRAATDTLSRVFNGSTETSRVHKGVATGNDTTMFTEGDFSRSVKEAALDSVKSLTWNLPHSSNPWPVSGSIVRMVNVKVTVSKGDRTESREVSRKITVTFPADAQGNVVLTINDKTCSLNLVTHTVTACT